MPINDTFHDSVYIKAKDQISEKVTKTDVNAILNSDVIPYFNPIDRWVKEHEHLPNKPEVIDQLLDTIPYKNPNARSFIKHWLLGIPATHAGEVVRLVLVLCGKQETGKTYWFRELLPESLQCYYSENNLMKDSEIHLALSSNIINMDDEFGGKSRKDALKFKEITSKKNFDVRLLYGNAMSSLKRRAMLCGTSNETEILNDETGNTRILPVEFHKKYNFKLYNSIDKDQLFIEIFRAYKRGESWQLDDDAKKTLDETNSTHSITDIELEMVDEYLFVNTEQYNKSIMSTTECKIHLEKVTGQKIISIRKLGLALKKRFEQIIIKVDGKTKRGYRCVTDKPRNQDTESQEVTEEKAPF